MEEQYQNEISNYNEEQVKRYNLIRDLQLGNIELSYSWLKEMLKSPNHFLNYKLKDREPQNESMIFGSLVDCLITEPENLLKNFVIVDKIPTTDAQKTFCNEVIKGALIQEAFNCAYKRGKAEDIYNELKPYIDAIINKQSTITTELLNEAKEVAERLENNETLALFLNNYTSLQEKVNIEYEGWKIKGALDIRSEINNNCLITDLKLMSKLNPNFIYNEIDSKYYDLQGAIYTLNTNERYFNACYDRKGGLLIVEQDETLLKYGKDKLDYCLRKLYECCENPSLFNESYNFHDPIDDKLGIKVKRIYKPGYAKSYRI